MKKIILVIMFIPAIWGFPASSAPAKKWYLATPNGQTLDNGAPDLKCELADMTPAEFITEAKNNGMTYSTDDSVSSDTGKVYMTFVTVKELGTKLIFVRGKKTCEKIFDLRRKAAQDNLERYR